MGLIKVFRGMGCKGFIYIPYEVMKEAYEKGLVTKIAVSNDSARVGGRGNIYFLYKNTNYVLMHVSANLYKVINRYIDTCVGKMDIVKEISNRCSFYKGRAGNVFCNPRKNLGIRVKTISLARIISSLERVGYIEDIDEGLECHHKVAREIESQNAIVLVSYDEHKSFHSLYGQKSRQNNWCWDSISRLVAGMQMVEFKDKQAALSPM